MTAISETIRSASVSGAVRPLSMIVPVGQAVVSVGAKPFDLVVLKVSIIGFAVHEAVHSPPVLPPALSKSQIRLSVSVRGGKHPIATISVVLSPSHILCSVWVEAHALPVPHPPGERTPVLLSARPFDPLGRPGGGVPFGFGRRGDVASSKLRRGSRSCAS